MDNKKRKGGFPKFTMDDYHITREGKIYNVKWNREVKPQPNDKGYLRFVVGGKRYFVHRVVAGLYVPNPENKPQVNHKDGNKINNNADNLEWVTNKENRQHAIEKRLHFFGEKCSWAKLTQKDVDFIREHTEYNGKQLAKMFSVSHGTILSIRNRKTWKYS